MLITITNKVENRIIELMNKIHGDSYGYVAICFHFSKLLEHYRGDYQITIAINIINDLFSEIEGWCFAFENSDIYLVLEDIDRSILEKAIFQLRYLFIDDPLAYNSDGSENDGFCDFYDLGFQWKEFFKKCKFRHLDKDNLTMPEVGAMLLERGITAPISLMQPKLPPVPLDLISLASILEKLPEIDFNMLIRRQSICALNSSNYYQPILGELYVHIAHLQKMIAMNVDLKSSKILFKYLTLELDKIILKMIRDRALAFFLKPLSINLNIETILSSDFEELNKILSPQQRGNTVVEIAVNDIFEDVAAFNSAASILKNNGYKLCIDGLNHHNFTRINWDALKVDLIKFYWNAENITELETWEGRLFAKMIEKFNSRRIILARCDDMNAINYGRKLGISLFQGRYIDLIITPDAHIIN